MRSAARLREDLVDTLLLVVGFFTALVALRVLAEGGPTFTASPS
jgi:hypothetical protein